MLGVFDMMGAVFLILFLRGGNYGQVRILWEAVR
jgi:hypothetical protein